MPARSSADAAGSGVLGLSSAAAGDALAELAGAWADGVEPPHPTRITAPTPPNAAARPSFMRPSFHPRRIAVTPSVRAVAPSHAADGRDDPFEVQPPTARTSESCTSLYRVPLRILLPSSSLT